MKKASNVGILVVSVLFLIFGVVMIILSNIGLGEYEATYKANNLLIGDLYDELSALKSNVEDVDDVEIVQANLKSCAELGRRVAELQTNYQNLSASADEDKFMANVNALDACFDEFSKNSRVPWYSVTNPETVQWTWTFQTTYEFVSRQVDVLWLCYANDTDDLLAYTTAVYNTETDLFSDVIYTMTSLGADYYYKDPTAGIDNPESGDVEHSVDDDVDPTIGGETIPDETVNGAPDTTQPTDANGETLPAAPDDIGGGGVADNGGSDRLGS